MLTQQTLEELATVAPRRLVVSVHVRTDPRDPANTSTTPAWLIELRNGLRAVSDRLERGEDRDARLAFRTLGPEIERQLLSLSGAERARSVSWIVDGDGDGAGDPGGDGAGRFSLQLPLRGDRVVADSRPFVSPLLDIADRGAPVGIVLAGSDLVRLVQITQGEATEPPDSTFELNLGDWRPFGGSAGGSSERGRVTTSHEESYRARVQAQRDRLFDTAASETARRLDTLGWESIVLVMEGQVSARFRDALGPQITERVIAEADLNLVSAEPTTIADALEPLIEEAWLRRTTAVALQAGERARAGGAATIGAPETLAALVEGRVHHLVLDPEHDFSRWAAMVGPMIPGPPELLAERAVEAAVRTGARVSALPVAQSPPLQDAGGIAALLRY